MAESARSLAEVAQLTLSAIRNPRTSAQAFRTIDKDWDYYLDLCRWNADHSVDWGAARILFQAAVPEAIMRDTAFKRYMAAYFRRTCGAAQGLYGAKKIFARYGQ